MGTERNDDLGRSAMDQGRTRTARWPAVGGLGDTNDLGRGDVAGTEGELLRLGGPQWVRDERVGVGVGPTQMSGSETRRSRPKPQYLASRGKLK